MRSEALVISPALGSEEFDRNTVHLLRIIDLSDHRYVRWAFVSVFTDIGLPCPTTIFTFGLLLRSGRSVPLYVLPVPIAWSLLGFSAAYSLGIWEDVGLLLAGLIGGFLLVNFHTRQSHEISSRLSLKEELK
jgi:hypothetical protein